MEHRGEMATSSFCHHMEKSHGIVLPQSRGVDVGGRGMETYMVYFPWILKLLECPVDGCPERPNSPGGLMEHFMYQHWKSKVAILQEGMEPLPRCAQ